MASTASKSSDVFFYRKGLGTAKLSPPGFEEAKKIVYRKPICEAIGFQYLDRAMLVLLSPPYVRQLMQKDKAAKKTFIMRCEEAEDFLAAVEVLSRKLERYKGKTLRSHYQLSDLIAHHYRQLTYVLSLYSKGEVSLTLAGRKIELYVYRDYD